MRGLTFVLLCLEGAVLSFNVAAAAAMVPSIAEDFGVSAFLAGRIVWLYMLPYGAAALFYGPLVRMFDARRLELLCIFFFSLANLLAGLSRDIHTLFVARFLTGVFGASVIPLGLILISRTIEASSRGRYVGIFFSSTFVASLFGLFLSSLLPWRSIFYIPAAGGLVLLCLMYPLLPSFRQERTGPRVNYAGALRDRRVLSVFTCIFFVSLLYHGVQQWLAVYFSLRWNFSQFVISMLITFTSMSGIFGEVLGGWIADKASRKAAAGLGIALMTVVVFLLLLKLPVWALSIAMIVWGFGWTVNHAGLSTMLTELPDEFINEAASLNSSIRFVAGGAGALIGGLLLQQGFTLYLTLFGYCLIFLAVLAKRLLWSPSD